MSASAKNSVDLSRGASVRRARACSPRSYSGGCSGALPSKQELHTANVSYGKIREVIGGGGRCTIFLRSESARAGALRAGVMR